MTEKNIVHLVELLIFVGGAAYSFGVTVIQYFKFRVKKLEENPLGAGAVKKLLEKAETVEKDIKNLEELSVENKAEIKVIKDDFREYQKQVLLFFTSKK